MCTVTVRFPVWDVMNFEMNRLSNQAVFLHDQKSFSCQKSFQTLECAFK